MCKWIDSCQMPLKDIGLDQTTWVLRLGVESRRQVLLRAKFQSSPQKDDLRRSLGADVPHNFRSNCQAAHGDPRHSGRFCDGFCEEPSSWLSQSPGAIQKGVHCGGNPCIPYDFLIPLLMLQCCLNYLMQQPSLSCVPCGCRKAIYDKARKSRCLGSPLRLLFVFRKGPIKLWGKNACCIITDMTAHELGLTELHGCLFACEGKLIHAGHGDCKPGERSRLHLVLLL